MKHPSLSRKTAIIINILLLLILTILSSLGSNSLKREAQNSNNQIKSNIAKEEIIGNINQYTSNINFNYIDYFKLILFEKKYSN